MLVPEVPLQVVHIVVILVFAVGVAEVAEQVVSSQMAEEFVAVHVARVAKLAQRVTSEQREMYQRIPLSDNTKYNRCSCNLLNRV